jgi:hypothetical protein
MNSYSQVCQQWAEALRSVALLIALSSASVFAVGAARADDGRDFAGGFHIVSTVAIDADTTRVTIRLRVQNVSGHDVANAVVLLKDDMPGDPLGSFPALMTTDDRAMVEIEGSFDVPSERVQHWEQGPGPQFEVVYQDMQGQDQRRPVETVPMLIGGEG